MTPMMKEYVRTKEQYKDCILFYRLGDFYEMFFEDAKLVSKELELTLTGKDCGLDERAPMCGDSLPCRGRVSEPAGEQRPQGRHLRTGGRSEAGQRPGETGSHQDRDPGYQHERPGSG